ncbi:MAG: hypothetical protein H7Y27_12230 [Gemmatimonadaceae bacterium]|nr:hypothetical protein [Chitinophagaceae bacterium]
MSDLLKHKLLGYETLPPAANWEAVSERLDDDNQYAYLSGKLSAWSVPPPPDAWLNISKQLDESDAPTIIANHAPLIQMNRRYMKWAVAAALIILAGGWIYFTQFNNRNSEMAVNSEADTSATAGDTRKLQEPVAVAGPSAIAPAASIASVLPVAGFGSKTVPREDPRVLKFSPVENNSVAGEYNITISSPLIRDENAAVMRDMAPMTANSNYMMVSGPDGSRTRISSRFGEFIRYMHDDENSQSTGPENALWKKRFAEWRVAIKESSYFPAAGNFLDIMELKDLIEKNQ